MKMTKETILKEDGRLLVYYRFGRAAEDAETPRYGLVDHSGQARGCDDTANDGRCDDDSASSA